MEISHRSLPGLLDISCFGAPRIELGSRAPKARILPLYYAPKQEMSPKDIYYRYTTPRPMHLSKNTFTIAVLRPETGNVPKGYILPLYYTPTNALIPKHVYCHFVSRVAQEYHESPSRQIKDIREKMSFINSHFQSIRLSLPFSLNLEKQSRHQAATLRHRVFRLPNTFEWLYSSALSSKGEHFLPERRNYQVSHVKTLASFHVRPFSPRRIESFLLFWQ